MYKKPNWYPQWIEAVNDAFEHVCPRDMFAMLQHMEDGFNVQVVEEADSYTVQVVLPGFQRDGIQVEYGRQYVLIQAVHDERNMVESEGYYEQTAQFGHFYKKIYLGAIRGEEMTVTHNDGVLTLHVPKDNSPSHHFK
ncbi:Molecular chaperone IbpA, HSP20 family [Alteribacillus persepolensis]|uniref:Molecular chaperone IbpA, HSP20 family n=1 Tax=Alteribacillus persepolensis TaxID=568899 RepID=A0A1G8H5Q4_9BACI|nr:Hsp20/alpha crystallin family protein [Alteribacillus persepolensis]SDI01955.1 Molecular chaperone IbpA, HSP20 family [Alteribacillus persepolensis]